VTRKPDELQNVLIKIILHSDLSEQSQIQEKLSEEGVDIPQSTLSRWLKKLNIVKVNNRYQMVNQESLTRLPVFSIKASLPNIILLHTLPGSANALAYQIDQKMQGEMSSDDPYKGVMGTIAGDDTVMIIMEDKESLLRFKAWFEQNKDNYFVLYD
jgi:transcriptional regulator of arginine metabolism